MSNKIVKKSHKNLILNNITLERVNSIKVLVDILDENINWNLHIELVRNKISKNIGILYRASFYLDKESLKSIYFSFIHSYIGYYNQYRIQRYFGPVIPVWDPKFRPPNS